MSNNGRIEGHYNQVGVVGQGALVRDHASVTMENMTINNYGQYAPHSQSLLQALRFTEMKQREYSVEDAHSDTCRWLLETPKYLLWTAEIPAEKEHCFLWIKGCAGAGKSTLMKFAVEHARRESNALILPHFFNARGSRLESSAEGMFRTLIVWLLDALPGKAKEGLDRKYNHRDEGESWPVAELERLLKKGLADLGEQTVIFFIDALDECDQQEARAMLYVFRDLIAKSWASDRRGQVRVCFASRPYPNITFDAALYLDLSTQEEHGQDITAYIQDRLRIGHSRMAARVRDDVSQKANGIFMWVVLVVDRLNQEYDDGNVAQLQEALEEIPPGLYELFRNTLDRYPGSREPLLVCFQWNLFAFVNLNARQFWWSVQLGLGRDEEHIAREFPLQQESDFGRYVVAVSRGLLRVRKTYPKDPSPTEAAPELVEFIHESLREFILKEQNLRMLYGAQNREDFQAQSHERLRDLCLQQLLPRQLPLISAHNAEWVFEEQYPPSVIEKRLKSEPSPLAQYAMRFLLKHAESAQEHGRDQTAFLDAIITRSELTVCLEPVGGKVLTIDPALGIIDVLLSFNLPELLRETRLEEVRRARQAGRAAGLHSQIIAQSESPLYARLWSDTSWVSHSSIRALVDLYLRLETRNPRIQDILSEIARSWNHRAWCDLELSWYLRTKFSLLNVYYVYPKLAIFFLIALTPKQSLEPHLDAFEELYEMDSIETADKHLPFLKIVRFLLEEDLTSDAINFYDPGLNIHCASCRLFVWTPDCVLCTTISDIQALIRSRRPAH